MKRFISLLIASTVGLSVISLATPAQATATVHTVTPTTQDPGKNIAVGASVAVPVSGKTDNIITHTWPVNRLTYVEATAPDGWLIEYKTAGGWSATKPSDLSTLIGIRTSGSLDSYGVSNGKQKLQTTATSTLAPGSAGTFVSASRGDGWGGFTSKKYLLNVYHHDGDYRLECHLKLTGELCGDLYVVGGLNTSRVSGGFVANEKAYSFVSDGNNSGAAAVVCTDVSELPFTSCGVTDFAGTSWVNAQNDLSSEAFDGRRIWAADFKYNELRCFDTKTDAPCANQVAHIDNLARTDGTPGYLSFIGGKIFISAQQVWCFDPETATACSGSWPADVSGTGSRSGVVPHATSGGVQDGVCSITVSYECFDFAGTSLTTPSGLQSLLTTASTKFAGGNGYWQTTAYAGTHLIWQSNPYGSDWSDGRATCYDWATDSACADFNSTVDIGARRYSLALDPNNPLCVLANGDDGNIFAFDINSGEKGCVNPDDAKALFKASAIAPQVSCANDGNIRTFDSVTLEAPPGLSTSDLLLTVLDGSRQDIPGFTNLAPNVNGVIDLSALTIDVASNHFQFIVTAAGMTLEQAANVQAKLRYTADLPELCVTLRVKADCPDVWGSRANYPQTGLSITSETSVKPTGASATVASQTTVATINPAVSMNCATFNGLTGPNGQGISDLSIVSQIVTMAWSPEGQLYVGGVFHNAGGDPNADYIARWNGTNWEAVGPTGNENDGFNSAINDRVAALVFDKTGKLVVGGHFNDAAGIDLADKVAIFNPADNTWSAPGVTQSISGTVHSLSLNPTTGKVVATGPLYSVNGDSSMRGIVELDPENGYLVSAMNPDGALGNYVHYSTFGPDKNLYIGGWFNAFGGGSGATFDGTDWTSLPQNFNPGDAVRAIAFSGTKMYVGGNFTGVRVYDSADSSWSWLGGSETAVAGSVRSLLVSSAGDLYIGGNFTNFNSARVIKYVDGEFFPLIDNGTGSESFDYSQKYGFWGGVWAIAESPQGQIYLAGDFQNAGENENADYITVFSASAPNLTATGASPSPSPTQSSASPSPSPTQSSASPSPSPTQSSASPSPSPSQSSASPSPSPTQSSASPSPSPSQSSASPSPSPSEVPVPTTTKVPVRPEDKNLTGLVVNASTKIKEPTVDAPEQKVVTAAAKQVDLAPDVTTAYKVHGNDADRGLVTIPTNTVIQADTTLFKSGDVVNAYLQSPTGIYFSLGDHLTLNGPLVLAPMRFLKPGRYEIIVTQVGEVAGFKRHYVKAPIFGAKTTRIVVYVIPPKASVHFAFCKYALSAKAKADLKELAVRLRGAGVVTITGYTQTDLTSPASRAANKVLSVNRAKAVAAYLRKQGLHVRMIIVGKGATNPVDNEHQYKNRRVTISYGF